MPYGFVDCLKVIKRDLKNAVRVAKIFEESKNKKKLSLHDLFVDVDNTHCITLDNAVTILRNLTQTNSRQYDQASLQETQSMMDQLNERTLLANQTRNNNREILHSI